MLAGGVLLGSVGCHGGSACVTPPHPAVFELGTGDTCFQRLTTGQTVPVNVGPQGGYHLWMAAGCADCGTTAALELGVKDPATKMWLSPSPVRLVAELSHDHWGQIAGMTAFLPGDPFNGGKNKLPKGTHVLLSMRALKADSTELHAAEVELVLGDEQDSSCSADPSCGMEGRAPCCNAGGLN